MLQVSVSPREDRASTRARVPGTLGVSLLSRAGYLHTTCQCGAFQFRNPRKPCGYCKNGPDRVKTQSVRRTIITVLFLYI